MLGKTDQHILLLKIKINHPLNYLPTIENLYKKNAYTK